MHIELIPRIWWSSSDAIGHARQLIEGRAGAPSQLQVNVEIRALINALPLGDMVEIFKLIIENRSEFALM